MRDRFLRKQLKEVRLISLISENRMAVPDDRKAATLR